MMMVIAISTTLCALSHNYASASSFRALEHSFFIVSNRIKAGFALPRCNN